MKRTIVYVNPQSMLNLSIYDHHLMSAIEGEIHYVCSKFYDYKPLPTNIRQHRLFRYNRLKSNIAKAVSYIFTCLQFFICLLFWRPQIIHIQWLRIPFFDLYFYKLVKCVLHCHIVFTAHNILPHDTGERQKNLYIKFYRLTDRIIVHTNSTKQELLSVFNVPVNKVAVIAHGIIHLNFDQQELTTSLTALNSQYHLKGKMVFSCLGHQYYYKGVDVIAKVWAETPELRNNSQCCLLLIGRNRGVDFSIVSNIENVIIEDRLLTDVEFYYLLRHTDVHLLTYRTISQSGLLLTAISTETPVLVTDIGGLTDPLDVAPIGWVLPHFDEDHLRKQLLWFLDHPEEIEKVKNDKTSWGLVHKHYNWVNIGRQTQQLYEQVCLS